jgi:hypothetical protein
LSRRPGAERGIEVKGRVDTGEVALTENEWARACNLRERYWPCVAFDCGTAAPRLFEVQDPFCKLIARPQCGVTIGYADVARRTQAD